MLNSWQKRDLCHGPDINLIVQITNISTKLYTILFIEVPEILDVNLFAFAYRLFHEDFSPHYKSVGKCK